VLKDYKDVMSKLEYDFGYRTWIVGGAVRDMLTNRTVGDYDLATVATPEQIKMLFSGAKSISSKFHAVCYIPTLAGDIEVATLRTESAYTDGRRPSIVEYTDSLVDDLSRRDFTINAMAKGITRLICDPFGGSSDIRSKQVRCVGDPWRRFMEHPVRLLRAIRFGSLRGFTIECQTWKQLKASMYRIVDVPWETIGKEFLKGLNENPTRYVNLLISSGLCKYVMPELLPMRNLRQNIHHGDRTILQHSLDVAERCPTGLIRLAALLHDIGKPATKTFKSTEYGNQFLNHDIVGTEIAYFVCTRLRLTEREKELVVAAVRWHMRDIHNARTARRLLARCNGDIEMTLFTTNLMDADKEDPIGSRGALIKDVIAHGDAVTFPQLAINGNDVMRELNIQQGPGVGGNLRAGLEYVLDNPQRNTKEHLIWWLRQRYGINELPV
jgi:tRNA nucleotidyltransferase (CCA-adding enzyme)